MNNSKDRNDEKNVDHDRKDDSHGHKDEKEHGHDKECTIVVNGREKSFKEKTISFIQVVELAFGVTTINEKTIYTITYSKGNDKKPQGTMVIGDTITIKCGMIFNVTATDKS